MKKLYKNIKTGELLSTDECESSPGFYRCLYLTKVTSFVAHVSKDTFSKEWAPLTYRDIDPGNPQKVDLASRHIQTLSSSTMPDLSSFTSDTVVENKALLNTIRLEFRYNGEVVGEIYYRPSVEWAIVDTKAKFLNKRFLSPTSNHMYQVVEVTEDDGEATLLLRDLHSRGSMTLSLMEFLNGGYRTTRHYTASREASYVDCDTGGVVPAGFGTRLMTVLDIPVKSTILSNQAVPDSELVLLELEDGSKIDVAAESPEAIQKALMLHSGGKVVFHTPRTGGYIFEAISSREAAAYLNNRSVLHPKFSVSMEKYGLKVSNSNHNMVNVSWWITGDFSEAGLEPGTVSEDGTLKTRNLKGEALEYSPNMWFYHMPLDATFVRSQVFGIGRFECGVAEFDAILRNDKGDIIAYKHLRKKNSEDGTHTLVANLSTGAFSVAPYMDLPEYERLREEDIPQNVFGDGVTVKEKKSHEELSRVVINLDTGELSREIKVSPGDRKNWASGPTDPRLWEAIDLHYKIEVRKDVGYILWVRTRYGRECNFRIKPENLVEVAERLLIRQLKGGAARGLHTPGIGSAFIVQESPEEGKILLGLDTNHQGIIQGFAEVKFKGKNDSASRLLAKGPAKHLTYVKHSRNQSSQDPNAPTYLWEVGVMGEGSYVASDITNNAMTVHMESNDTNLPTILWRPKSSFFFVQTVNGKYSDGIRVVEGKALLDEGWQGLTSLALLQNPDKFHVDLDTSPGFASVSFLDPDLDKRTQVDLTLKNDPYLAALTWAYAANGAGIWGLENLLNKKVCLLRDTTTSSNYLVNSPKVHIRGGIPYIDGIIAPTTTDGVVASSFVSIPLDRSKRFIAKDQKTECVLFGDKDIIVETILPDSLVEFYERNVTVDDDGHTISEIDYAAEKLVQSAIALSGLSDSEVLERADIMHPDIHDYLEAFSGVSSSTLLPILKDAVLSAHYEWAGNVYDNNFWDTLYTQLSSRLIAAKVRVEEKEEKEPPQLFSEEDTDPTKVVGNREWDNGIRVAKKKAPAEPLSTAVAYKVAATQLSRLSSVPLEALLIKYLPKADPTKIKEFLSSQAGQAFLAAVSAAGMSAVSQGYTQGRLARELRVLTLAMVGDTLSDALLQPLMSTLTEALRGVESQPTLSVSADWLDNTAADTPSKIPV